MTPDLRYSQSATTPKVLTFRAVGRSENPGVPVVTRWDSNRDLHSRAPSLFSRNNQEPDLTSFKTMEDDDYGFKSRFSSSQVRNKSKEIRGKNPFRSQDNKNRRNYLNLT